MGNNASQPRDLLIEIMALLNAGFALTDIHIEQDATMMMKTPRGWKSVSDVPVTLEDMVPLLDTIDQDWEDKIVECAIDRPILLAECKLRCNVYRMASGAKVTVTMRCLPLHPISLEKTGLPSCVKAMLEPTKGIILVTGSTGSGKTTTIAAMLDDLNASRSAHIITIEEPIEYQLDRKQSIISQKEVPTDTATFATGLREAMRQKPDILMVGEIRDFDTADNALYASESGHLVLATMDTNSALSAITTLLGFFPQEQRQQCAAALANSLVGVIFQSLLPTKDGEAFVLASEMIFNNNQQVAPFIADTSKAHMISEFMKQKTDSMSQSLNGVLAQFVEKKLINPKDAMRSAYNRPELHKMLNSQE